MKNNYILLSVLVSFLSFAMEPADPEQVRVMTYNIRRAGTEKKEERQWANRLPLVKKIIERLKPDIMGLQEVTETQLNDFKREVPTFNAVGTSRGSSWFGMGADEYNPILYDTNRFILLAAGTFAINRSKSRFGWTPLQATATGLLPRICSYVTLKDKKNGAEFLVFNTHLDNNYQEARLNGLAEIAERMPLCAKNRPVILMGDFNTEIDSEIQRVIPTFKPAIDSAKLIYGPRETRTGWDDEELKSIDHILINDTAGTNVLRYEIVQKEEGPYPSDHRPVIADVTFAGK